MMQLPLQAYYVIMAGGACAKSGSRLIEPGHKLTRKGLLPCTLTVLGHWHLGLKENNLPASEKLMAP